MTTAREYAPEPTEQTKRLAVLAAGRHFGSEAIQITGCAVEDSAHTVIAYHVEGHDPRGWDLLGDSIVITVTEDGEVNIEADES